MRILLQSISCSVGSWLSLSVGISFFPSCLTFIHIHSLASLFLLQFLSPSLTLDFSFSPLLHSSRYSLKISEGKRNAKKSRQEKDHETKQRNGRRPVRNRVWETEFERGKCTQHMWGSVKETSNGRGENKHYANKGETTVDDCDNSRQRDERR